MCAVLSSQLNLIIQPGRVNQKLSNSMNILNELFLDLKRPSTLQVSLESDNDSRISVELAKEQIVIQLFSGPASSFSFIRQDDGSNHFLT